MPTTDPSFAIIQYVSWGAGLLAKSQLLIHLCMFLFLSSTPFPVFLFFWPTLWNIPGDGKIFWTPQSTSQLRLPWSRKTPTSKSWISNNATRMMGSNSVASKPRQEPIRIGLVAFHQCCNRPQPKSERAHLLFKGGTPFCLFHCRVSRVSFSVHVYCGLLFSEELLIARVLYLKIGLLLLKVGRS